MKKKKNLKRGMIDVGSKQPTKRTAVATAKICMNARAYVFLNKDKNPKGDVLETAKIAGIMAAKKTPDVIPLCHVLGELNCVSLEFKKKKNMVAITSEVASYSRTGVEMEALLACAVSALTIYDMLKWADKGMVIQEIKLLKKTGGKSGDYPYGFS